MDQTIADLIQRSAEANSALMRGDIKKYREVIPHTDDFTLMSPFGGKPTRASELTTERIEAMGRFFKNGTFEQELVQAYGSADMVVLAIIERPHVEVGGLPAQDWALRVTLVYRREGAEWRLAHRHADPPSQGCQPRTCGRTCTWGSGLMSKRGVGLVPTRGVPDPTPDQARAS